MITVDPLGRLTLAAIIGPPAAGKSTLARTWPAAVVSLDQLRAELSPHGEAEDQNVTADAVQAMHAEIVEHLAGGCSVLVDATNAARPHRLALLDLTRPFDALSLALVLRTPLPEVLYRNGLRSPVLGKCGFAPRVPPHKVTAMHAEITADLPTLHTEGWPMITEVPR